MEPVYLCCNFLLSIQGGRVSRPQDKFEAWPKKKVVNPKVQQYHLKFYFLLRNGDWAPW